MLPTSNNTKLRLSTGSLQNLSRQQLTKLKAEVGAALEARWQRDNRTSAGSRGRPDEKKHVYEACLRIKKRMRARKKTTLSDWYQAVREDVLKRHSRPLSHPTIKKFTRDWLIEHVPFAHLPEEIGAYYIRSKKEFDAVRWILIWSVLWQQFSEVQRWLKEYQGQHGTLPGELPEDILPFSLKEKLNSRLDHPLGPKCYDVLIRFALRRAKAQCDEGARYPLVLRSFLGSSTEK